MPARSPARLYTRNAMTWTMRLPVIAAASERIKAKSFTIDGEGGSAGARRLQLARRSRPANNSSHVASIRIGAPHIKIDLASPAEVGLAEAGNGARSVSASLSCNCGRGRGTAIAATSSPSSLGGSVCIALFCFLRTSTSRRCALAAAAATSRVTRDAQPTQLQRWKGTPHERWTPSQ
jgi:hypothetical protein